MITRFEFDEIRPNAAQPRGCAPAVTIIGEGGTLQFVVIEPPPPFSMNQSRGTHWSRIRKSSKSVQRQIGWLASGARQIPVPATVHCTWYGPRPRDDDNFHSAALYGIKWVLDGLVKARLLPDDCREFVTMGEIGWKEGKRRCLRIWFEGKER